MATKTPEYAHKPGLAASRDALLHSGRTRTAAPPPTAEGAPPGVCESRDAARVSARLSQTSEVCVLAEPVCASVEDLFVVAGLFDERIAEILSRRREAFGIPTSPRRLLSDPDPALKPIAVSRR